MNVGAIVLAAGSARRMGADKMLADLGGKPVVRHVVDAIATAGLPIPIVAVPPGADLLIAALGPRVRPIEVKDHLDGMGHSLAAAIAAAPDHWDAVIVCLGDMPFVPPALLAALAAQADPTHIIAPSFGEKRGNPVAWGRDFFPDLAALRGDRGGRSLIERAGDRLVLIEWTDADILIDIDTPEALAAARARL